MVEEPIPTKPTMENAVATITAMWECTEAQTISPKDVEDCSNAAPCFGCLREPAGVKVYAFLGDGEIRKKVIPVRDGTPLDYEGVLSKIKCNGFSLHTLHRRR